VEFYQAHGSSLAVIAVPDYAAQQVLELMLRRVSRGPEFAPTASRLPLLRINNINLETS